MNEMNDNAGREGPVDATAARWLLSMVVAGALLWVASRKTFYGDSISSVFLSVALFSIFLILLRTRIHWKELSGVGMGAGLIYWLDVGLLGYKESWPVFFSCIGIAALGVLALRTIWSPESERRTSALTLSAAFLFVASEWCAGYFLMWGESARPRTLDLYLYSFDASLGVQPAVVMGQWFARVPWFAIVSQIVYLSLPVAMGLTFAGCVRRSRKQAIAAVVAFLITGPIGACFYTMFPALGPVHILNASFPWHALTMEQAKRLALQPIAVPGPRNAIPSLHAAWIFLVFWFAWRLSLAERIAAGFFVFFTLCATLGTGEHYFVDLVVAAPFGLLILAVTSGLVGKWRRELWAPLVGGLGMTLAWFGLLRYAAPVFRLTPVIPWAFCLATLGASGYILKTFDEEPKEALESAAEEQERGLPEAQAGL